MRPRPVRLFSVALPIAACLLIACQQAGPSSTSALPQPVEPIVADIFVEPQPGDVQFAGLLGSMIDNTAEQRLRYIAGHPLLLGGFEKKDFVSGGTFGHYVFEHPKYGGPTPRAWLGEHVGKWLHTAAVIGLSRQDDELLKSVTAIADELVSYQDADGYLATYDQSTRFTAPPGDFIKGTWDIWEHRYNLYGLLTAYRYLGNEAWLDASKKMGDLLVKTFGPGGRKITDYGTRRGISSLTVLESITQLYKMSGDVKYLDFAKYLVYTASEERTKVLTKLLAREGVHTIGDGKAYQLMAVMLGLLDLYQYTGEEEFYTAVIRGWEDIKHNHLTVTGGTWTKQLLGINNSECFAPVSYWTPFEHVENCAAITWLQLNCALLRITGDARFADEAEFTLYNQQMGSHTADCSLGTYFTTTNGNVSNSAREHTNVYHCCNSSWPRTYAVAVTHAYGYMDGGIAVNIYAPGSFQATLGGTGVTIAQETGYPLDTVVKFTITPEQSLEFPLNLRIPVWAKGVQVIVNGQPWDGSAQGGTRLTIKRRWSAGDVVDMTFAHQPELRMAWSGGKHLAAFVDGPLAYSTVLEDTDELHPLPGIAVDIDGAALQSVKGSNGPAYRMETKDLGTVTLLPYYQASSRNVPVATWFERVVEKK
jgi:uncharacterized protein